MVRKRITKNIVYTLHLSYTGKVLSALCLCMCSFLVTNVPFSVYSTASANNAEHSSVLDVACEPKNHIEATICSYVEAWNHRQLDTILELFSDDATYIGPAQIGFVHRHMPGFMQQVLEAMPDIYIRVHDMHIEAGEHVNVTWSAVGTNVGYFNNTPPRNTIVTVMGKDIFHIKFQRIVSHVHSEHQLY